MVATTRNTPQQLNGFDCGVFASYCAHYISLGVRPTFSQADMPHLRRRMMADILAKKIHASEMQFATISLIGKAHYDHDGVQMIAFQNASVNDSTTLDETMAAP
ncbi:hypothetical protein M885DRAFT_581071 [Pelagophyceae sp. CCMP2097]|nr:hypothetical protein M885DRAFT_581071 [Pelagophyceae sp. CCMP2097]